MNGQSSELDDLSLIKRYLETDDRMALGLLFERHSGLAYRMACRVMRNPDEAQDAVQAAFMNAIRFLPRYRGGAGFRVWLTKVVIGTCKKKIRECVRRRTREERSFEEQEILAMNEQSNKSRVAELTDAILAELDKLPDLYRLPIWLHYYENLPFQEVATALASSENTVKSQARRGMAMLKESLGNVGYAVPSASIIAAFPQMPAEALPPSLLSWIETSVRGTLPRAVGTGLSPLAISSIATAVGAAALGAVLWAAWPEKETEPAKPVSSDSGLVERSFAWRSDFNKPDSTNCLSAAYGSFRILPSGGPDGSDCLESTDELTLVDINVTIEKLPVLITYQRAGILPVPKEGAFSSLVCWNSLPSFARFHGIGRLTFGSSRDNVLPWLESREFVTDSFIDRWSGSDHIDFVAFKRADSSHLQLALRGRHRLDNLVIRSISSNELPKVDAYLAAIQRVPPAQRKGHVPVPEFRPGTPGGKTPTIFFHSESD